MSEIADFLRARYAERRAIAEAASPGPWHPSEEADEVLAVDGITVADGFALSGQQLRATVHHIAANDPDAVIADCDAKLAIIEEAEGSEISARNPDHDGGSADALSWVLWVFAQQFAEHPDFKGDKWSSPDGRAGL